MAFCFLFLYLVSSLISLFVDTSMLCDLKNCLHEAVTGILIAKSKALAIFSN